MRLQDALSGVLPNVQPNTNNVKAPSQTAFDVFFAEAEARQTETVPETTNQSRRDRRDDSDRTSRTERPDRSERTNRSERSERREERRTQAAEAANNASYAEQTTEVYVEEDSALAAVAAVLQIPVEAVVEMLEQLNMDIQDLADPKMVKALLQTALGAETAAALLKDPNFPEMYKAINEAMAKLALEAETVVLVNDYATKAQAVELEGLQLSYESESFVSTGQTSARAETSNTTTTQATGQEAQTQAATTATTLERTPEFLPVVEQDIFLDQPQVADPLLTTTTAKARVEQAVAQTTQNSPDVSAKDIIEQIMGQVRVTSTGGNFAEMRMTLRPESLGDIVLRVITQNGIVTAQFEAESQKIKETLEANFNQLRDALEEQGLQFSELSVSVREEGNERMNEFERARQASRRRMETIVNVGEVEEEPPQISLHNGTIDLTA